MFAPHVWFAVFSGLLLGQSAAASVEAKNNNIQWVDCTANVPVTLQGITLPTPLPSTLHCGRLDVPMDYSKPLSLNNKISIGFAMYRPESPAGLVNLNPGGPGGETASIAWEFALNSSQSMFAGLEGFDLLAIDPRGTFQSNPLNCSIGDFDLPSSFPATQTEFSDYQSNISTIAQSCIANSIPKGIISFVRTADLAQDWNSVRKALHYEKMHLISISYGTVGGIFYAHMFPKSVGRFVLDAIYAAGLTNELFVTYQTRAFNRLLLRADTYCIFDDQCPFHTQGKGSVISAFKTVLSQAAAGSFPNTTADDIRAMTFFAYLAGLSKFSAFNSALSAALGGDASGFDYKSFGPQLTQGLGPIVPLICADQHIDNNSFAEFDALRKSIVKDDPNDMQYTLSLLSVALCGGWPDHGNFDTALPTDAPMLLVTADFDLNTATEYATFIAQEQPQSVLLVRHGDGHGSILLPGTTRAAEIDFIKTGRLPDPESDALVTVYAPNSVRAPIPDPYSVPIGPDAGEIA